MQSHHLHLHSNFLPQCPGNSAFLFGFYHLAFAAVAVANVLTINQHNTMTWLEALPPLIIITAALTGMGTLQGAAYRAFNNGKVRSLHLPPSFIFHRALLVHLRKATTSHIARMHFVIVG